MPEMTQQERLACTNPLYRLVARQLLLSWAQQGERVSGNALEIGCSGGAMAAQLLRLDPELRLTATDYDPDMVRAVTRLLAPFGKRVAVQRADATDRSCVLASSSSNCRHSESELPLATLRCRTRGALLGHHSPSHIRRNGSHATSRGRAHAGGSRERLRSDRWTLDDVRDRSRSSASPWADDVTGMAQLGRRDLVLTKRRVLAAVAHPDDESFGLGSVIVAFSRLGAETAVLCFTHGEASTLGGVDGDLRSVRALELMTLHVCWE